MLDLSISPEEKRDIIQGSHEVIIEIINRMKSLLHSDMDASQLLNKTREANKENNESNETAHNESTQKEEPQKKNVPKAAVDINELQTDKDLDSSAN